MVLAGSGGKKRIARLRKLYTTGIVDDLTNSLSLYERLADDWRRSHTVWFTTLNELTDSRHTYTNNRDWIVLFDNEETRRRLAGYYRKSAGHLLQLQNAQSRVYAIQNSFNSLVQNLQLRRPEFTLDQARQAAVPLMPAESAELANLLDKTIPELVNGLEALRADAREVHALITRK
jgi:hypothetical protein